MKISWFKRDITPEVGTRVSGYGMEDVSFSQWSELLMTGLLADDGENKVLLISFDLQYNTSVNSGKRAAIYSICLRKRLC